MESIGKRYYKTTPYYYSSVEYYYSSVEYMPHAPRVDNKEKEEYLMRYMLCTTCLHRVMWLPALRMWPALGAKYLVFRKIVKNTGIFCEFCARIFINARLILSASIFSRNRTCISLHLRPHPWCTIWIERSHWSIFELLACDFPQTSYIEHYSIL